MRKRLEAIRKAIDVNSEEKYTQADLHWLLQQAEALETTRQRAGESQAAIHMALTYLGSGRYEEAENILDAAFQKEANDA